MKVYSYHPISREFTYEEDAFIDPIRGKAILPAHATFKKPDLEIPEGFVAIFDNAKDGNWELIEDHRGTVYNILEINHLPFPIGWDELGPLPPQYTKKVRRTYDQWDEEKEEWVGHEEQQKENFRYEHSHTAKRRDNYPDLREQLDMIYWDRRNGTDTWMRSITEIKTQYPKPENEDV